MEKGKQILKLIGTVTADVVIWLATRLKGGK